MERSVCEQLLGQLEKRLLAECFVSEKLLTPEQAAEIIYLTISSGNLAGILILFQVS